MSNSSPTLNDMAPERQIVPPAEGWKQSTLYLVHVSYNKHNPIHEAYLRVGFLDNAGIPAGYTHIWHGSYESHMEWRDVWYLKAVKVLHEEKT